MAPATKALAIALLSASASLIYCAQTMASDEVPAGIEELRAAMEKYKDPVVAVRDGYFSTLGCVAYESGTMGVHFINPALISPEPDPLKPVLLVYEPQGEKLELVAVEWLIPLATGIKSKPSLFGHPFDGPMEGHEPLLPAALHHYDLHAWIFKDNPKGMFSPVNPDVNCPQGPYSFVEEPPKSVPNPN